jgi:ketosteroid isomerase-like protein
MKILVLFVTMLIPLFSTSTDRAQDSVPRSRKEVEEAFNGFISAFNNLEWDKFQTALADEITVFNPEIPEAPTVNRLDGKQAVEDSFKGVFAASRQQLKGPPYLHIVPKRVRIQMLVDTAIVTFEFDREGNSMGRRTLVFHREVNGWKIVHIHASNVALKT